MAEIVNLRQARKRKRRGEKEARAAENRAQHGRAAGEKTATGLSAALAERRLEGHRRDASDEPDRDA